MSVERVARRRRWAGCLPVLLALLLAFGPSAVSRDAAQPPMSGQSGTALRALAAATHPANGRTQARLLANRAATGAVGSLVAIGRGGYALPAPSGRWMITAAAARSATDGRGIASPGRGPPAGL